MAMLPQQHQQMMQYVAWPGGQMPGQPMLVPPGAGMQQVMGSMASGTAMHVMPGPGGMQMQMVPMQAQQGAPMQMMMQAQPQQQQAAPQQAEPEEAETMQD